MEEFTMRSPVVLPPDYIRDEHARANHVGQRSPGALEHLLNFLDDEPGLFIRIAWAHDLVLVIDGHGAGHFNCTTYPDSPAVANDGFPFGC